MLLEALALAVLTHLGLITVHLVMGLASFYGLLSAFEVPTRQSLVSEIVGKDDLMNAIALNSSAFNVARVIGPSIAGALIATVGLAACFYVNAASYLAVLTGLLLMRVRRPAVPSRAPALGALKEGFGYIFGNPWPRALVTIVAGFSVFGASFLPMMPVYTRDVLGLDADGYGAVVSAIGLGAASGAIAMAATGGSDQARARGDRHVRDLRRGTGRRGARARLLVRAGTVHPRGLPDGGERHHRQHHAPARGARSAAGAGHGVLLLRGPGDGAVRGVPGRVGRRSTSGCGRRSRSAGWRACSWRRWWARHAAGGASCDVRSSRAKRGTSLRVSGTPEQDPSLRSVTDS